MTTSLPAEPERLLFYTDLMNELLPVGYLTGPLPRFPNIYS